MNNGSIVVNSVHKAFQILDLFLEKDCPLTLGEISRSLGYPKSTVHALLSTMLAHEMVWQQEDGKYVFGYRTMEYAFGIKKVWKAAGQSDNFMKQIMEETSFSVIFFAQASDYYINSNFMTNRSSSHLLPNYGERLPFFSTATGRLFLSTFSPVKLETVLKNEGFYEKGSGILQYNMAEELDMIRKKGFSLDFNERIEGQFSVSVLVPYIQGNTHFAFTTVGKIKELELHGRNMFRNREELYSCENINKIADIVKKYTWQYALSFSQY